MKKIKFGVLKSLLILSLAIILVSGGTTIAWFTAEFDLPSAAEMVVGTLEFEITGLPVEQEPSEGLNGGALEWQAGECKNLSWVLKNTGSKTSYYRARVKSSLAQFVQEETAWGEGTRYNNGKNWAMYFTHNPGHITKTRLLAGQNHEAGMVTVWEEEGRLHVKYDTKDGWFLTKTHLAVAESRADLPANQGGNLVPGQFPYKNSHLPVQSFTYVLDLPVYSPVYLAAHSKVVREGTEIVNDEQVSWSLPDGSAWEEGLDGWFYYCLPVKSGEAITLVLQGCLDEDAGNGLLCNIQLQAEAVQASHGAADEVWPGRLRTENGGKQ